MRDCVDNVSGDRTENKKKSNSAVSIMENMQELNLFLLFYPNKQSAQRIIEEPTEFQIEIPKAFDHKISTSGVLQNF